MLALIYPSGIKAECGQNWFCGCSCIPARTAIWIWSILVFVAPRGESPSPRPERLGCLLLLLVFYPFSWEPFEYSYQTFLHIPISPCNTFMDQSFSCHPGFCVWKTFLKAYTQDRASQFPSLLAVCTIFPFFWGTLSIINRLSLRSMKEIR